MKLQRAIFMQNTFLNSARSHCVALGILKCLALIWRNGLRKRWKKFHGYQLQCFYFLKLNVCCVISKSNHSNQFSLLGQHIFDFPYHVSYIMRNVPWARLFSRHTSDSDSYCRTAPWDHCEISRCLSQLSWDGGRERAKNMDEGSLTWFRSFVRGSGFNFCFWWILELDVLIQS